MAVSVSSAIIHPPLPVEVPVDILKRRPVNELNTVLDFNENPLYPGAQGSGLKSTNPGTAHEIPVEAGHRPRI